MTAPPSPSARLASWLRREPVGGALLVGAAILALIWANSRWSEAYLALGRTVVGPSALHLDLSLSTWAADGLLAIFFFVVGLELKQEFVTGSLRHPARAAVPIAAAVGGMAVPAAIYVAVVASTAGSAALGGWAVPMATDIAFALAVLAVLGRFLPAALRTFLLTLAVVDDLIAITVIALFYTADLAVGPLLLAALPLAAFAALTRRGVRSWWLLLPLAVLTWWLVHESGVHATVAGVLLGFAVPVHGGIAHRFELRWRPLSVAVALPVFAFFAAGVPVGAGLADTLADPVTVGIVVGLVVGKVLGVGGTVWAMETFTPARLDRSLGAIDVFGAALLAGIGFTVSLLISELAFTDEVLREHARVGVLAASTTAALLATAVLGARNHRLRTAAGEVRNPDDGSGASPR